jgi:hypothetical protein
VEQGQSWPAADPGIAVGGTCADAFKHGEHRPDFWTTVKGLHEQQFRRARVSEAHINSSCCSGPYDGLRTGHPRRGFFRRHSNTSRLESMLQGGG